MSHLRNFRVYAGLLPTLPSLEEAKKSEFVVFGSRRKEAEYLHACVRELARARQVWTTSIAMAKSVHGKMASYRVAKDGIHDAGSALEKALQTARTAESTSRKAIEPLTKPGVGNVQDQAQLLVKDFDQALADTTKARAEFSAMTKATTAKGPDAFWQWLVDV